MPADRCHGSEVRLVQLTDPVWEPLLQVVGPRLTETFMWMHEEEIAGSLTLHAYKHIHTRRYLYLTEDGRAFGRAHCGRHVPLRLDLAIEAALCSWWILSGWGAEDAAAVREARDRACERILAAWPRHDGSAWEEKCPPPA